MNIEIPLDKLPNVDKDQVLTYIRKMSWFDTILWQVLHWDKARIAVNLQKWLITDCSLPEDCRVPSLEKVLPNDLETRFKAILEYVHNKIKYVRDIDSDWKLEEYWQTPLETWTKKTGDCEDGAILIYALAKYYGIPDTNMYIVAGDVQGGGHCYVNYVSEKDALEYPIDWCYWYDTSLMIKLPYVENNNYFNGKKEWFRFNSSGMYKHYLG